jgi:hypothetical protein
MINLANVTGVVLGGFTAPVYNVTADLQAEQNTKTWIVSSLGGTQTGVQVHSNEMPFRFIAKRPTKIKIPGARSTTSGQYLTGGKNEFSYLTVKGANILSAMSGYQYENILFRTTVSTPAAIGNDKPQLYAAASFHTAAITQLIAGICDTQLQSVM